MSKQRFGSCVCICTVRMLVAFSFEVCDWLELWLRSRAGNCQRPGKKQCLRLCLRVQDPFRLQGFSSVTWLVSVWKEHLSTGQTWVSKDGVLLILPWLGAVLLARSSEALHRRRDISSKDLPLQIVQDLPDALACREAYAKVQNLTLKTPKNTSS